MSEQKINVEKLESICIASAPEKDGRQYYIYSPDFGMYSKHDAEVIQDFLRENIYKILQKISI